MTGQEAAAIVIAWQREWQRQHEKDCQLAHELARARERQLMCLDRSIAAHQRVLDQGRVSLFAQVFVAFLCGSPLPDGDVRMWDEHTKRMELYANSVEEERDALEYPSLSDLMNDLKGLEAHGPLPDGSSFHLEDGRVVPLCWIFVEGGERIFFLVNDAGSYMLLGGGFPPVLIK